MEYGRRVDAADGAPIRTTQARLDRLWFLIASMPVVFAVATWSPSGMHTALHRGLLFYSLPVLALECFATLLMQRLGARPLQMLRSQALWVRAALLALLAIMAGTTVFAAPNALLSAIRTGTSLLHLLFGLSLASLLGKHLPRTADRIWPPVVGGLCALVLLIALYVAAAPASAPYAFWEYWGLAASNVRQLGFYALVGAAAALGLAAGARSRTDALIWASAASVMLALMFWSGTRSALFALACSLGVAALTLPAARSLRLLVATVAATLVGAALSLLHTPPIVTMGLLRTVEASKLGGAEDVSSGRLELWTDTLAACLNRPFFGYGAGQFRLAVPGSGDLFNHPHNVVLQLLIEWGAVGAALALALGGLCLWHFHGAVRANGHRALPAWLVAVGLLAFSMVEGALYHPWPVMMFAVAIASVLGTSIRQARPSPAFPPPPAPGP